MIKIKLRQTETMLQKNLVLKDLLQLTVEKLSKFSAIKIHKNGSHSRTQRSKLNSEMIIVFIKQRLKIFSYVLWSFQLGIPRDFQLWEQMNHLSIKLPE